MKSIFQHWAKAGGIAGIFLLVVLLNTKTDWSGIEILFPIHLCLLLFHQFEEYVLPGGFKDYFNTNLYRRTSIIRTPLTDSGILIVNVIIAWSAYGLSAWYSTNLLWLAIGLALITLTNGILHTTMAFVQRKYNPGVLSGALLFIPFGIWFLSRLLSIGNAADLTGGILVFIMGTASIPLSIYITGRLSHEKLK